MANRDITFDKEIEHEENVYFGTNLLKYDVGERRFMTYSGGLWTDSLKLAENGYVIFPPVDDNDVPDLATEGEFLLYLSGDGSMVAKRKFGGAQITTRLDSEYEVETYPNAIHLTPNLGYVGGAGIHPLGLISIGLEALDIQSSRDLTEQVAGGTGSLAIGGNNVSSGPGATSFGHDNYTLGLLGLSVGYANGSNASTQEYATGVGVANYTGGARSTGFGYYNNTIKLNDTILCGSRNGGLTYLDANNITGVGYHNFYSVLTSLGDNSTSIGYENNSNVSIVGNNSTAVGSGNKTAGVSASAFGYKNIANSTRSTAVGYKSEATAINASAFGYQAYARNSQATAFGYKSEALGVNSAAFGNTAIATADNSIAVGRNVNNVTANSVEIGATATAKLRVEDTGHVIFPSATGSTSNIPTDGFTIYLSGDGQLIASSNDGVNINTRSLDASYEKGALIQTVYSDYRHISGEYHEGYAEVMRVDITPKSYNSLIKIEGIAYLRMGNAYHTATSFVTMEIDSTITTVLQRSDDVYREAYATPHLMGIIENTGYSPIILRFMIETDSGSGILFNYPNWTGYTNSMLIVDEIQG